MYSLKVMSSKVLAQTPAKPLLKEEPASTRKAFGNVSNVRGQHVVSGKTHTQLKAGSTKKESTVFASKLKPTLDKSKEVVNEETSSKSVFMEEVENMFPVGADEYNEMQDPITVGMYAIEEKVVYSMKFDDNMSEYLLPIDYDNIF